MKGDIVKLLYIYSILLLLPLAYVLSYFSYLLPMFYPTSLSSCLCSILLSYLLPIFYPTPLTSCLYSILLLLPLAYVLSYFSCLLARRSKCICQLSLLAHPQLVFLYVRGQFPLLQKKEQAKLYFCVLLI